MSKLFKIKNFFISYIHIRYDLLVDNDFFSDIFFDGWAYGEIRRVTIKGRIFFYAFFISVLVLLVNCFFVFFCKVGDKRTFTYSLWQCKTNPQSNAYLMTALTPDETTKLMPFFEFLDNYVFQIFFGWSLVFAKFCLFFFIIFWCIFLFKFCVYGFEKEKAIYLADNFMFIRFYAFFYTFCIFFIAIIILFLIPGIDDFFLARHYIPPFRWLYVDCLVHFNGYYYFYTGKSWGNSRVWMPNTYGSHISFYFFHATDLPWETLSLDSQFIIDMQLKTYYKELDIYLKAYPRLTEIRHKEITMFYFVHKDPSIFYDIIETAIKLKNFIIDEIDKFRKK